MAGPAPCGAPAEDGRAAPKAGSRIVPAVRERARKGMWATLAGLWRGEAPLRVAFWEYAIAYGLLINVLSTGAALIGYSVGAPFVLSGFLFLLHVPYNLFAAVAVWRSAGRYRGRQLWADLARAGVIVWTLGATFI